MKENSFWDPLNKNTKPAFSFRDFLGQDNQIGRELLAQNYQLIETIKDYPGKSTYLSQ